MAVTASVHTLQDYLDQAAPVLLEIPGLSQLMQANGNSYDVLAGMYPDAAFTLMVMNNLFHHDCEFSEIHQQAFSAIIGQQYFCQRRPLLFTAGEVIGVAVQKLRDLAERRNAFNG